MLIITCNKNEARAVFMGKCCMLAEIIDSGEVELETLPQDVLDSLFWQSIEIFGIQ